MQKKSKPVCEWTSQNPFINIEAERMHFADYEGILSAEEMLRFAALDIKAQFEKYGAINDWLNTTEHAETLEDLPKIRDKLIAEEALAEAESELY